GSERTENTRSGLAAIIAVRVKVIRRPAGIPVINRAARPFCQPLGAVRRTLISRPSIGHRQKGRPRMLDALLLWLGAIAIGFVLPIKTTREIVLRDAVFLAIVTVVAATLLLDGNLTQYEGVALIALFVPYVLNLAISQRTGPAEEIRERIEDLEIGLAFTGWI